MNARLNLCIHPPFTVGHRGQCNLVNCGTDIEKAKSTFEQKFWDKTKNEWMSRDNFVKVAGKYDMLKLDYDIKVRIRN